MRILVSGGAGFIGSHIVDRYVEKGHRVWVIDDESSGKKGQVSPKAFYSRIDIRDRKKLAALFEQQAFDVVNHHAAQIDVRRSVEDPVRDADINLIGLLNILTLCRENKTRKIIFSSSGGTVYGECPKPATEKSVERPLSPYGVAKLASEKYIQAFAALYPLRYTIFRYANVYGPRQDPHGEAGVVAIFASRLLKKKPVTIFGSGRQTRDFVFVGDVVEANELALTQGDNETFNIGTNRAVSVNTLYKVMARVCGVHHPAIRARARIGELQNSVLSYAKIHKKLGWKPRTSLQQGLEKAIRHFQS